MPNLLNPRNMMQYARIAKISGNIDKHINKRCAYCNLELGNELPVVKLLEHLIECHIEKVDMKEIKEYDKIIKKNC